MYDERLLVVSRCLVTSMIQPCNLVKLTLCKSCNVLCVVVARLMCDNRTRCVQQHGIYKTSRVMVTASPTLIFLNVVEIFGC